MYLDFLHVELGIPFHCPRRAVNSWTVHLLELAERSLNSGCERFLSQGTNSTSVDNYSDDGIQ